MSLFKYSLLVPKFILLEYLVDNGYVYLLSINFSYKQVNPLSGCRKKTLFLHYLKDALIRFLSLYFGTIIVSKLKADIS